jgi:hypothetical protein
MYRNILKYNQLKLLNLFNLDKLSSKIGIGDRKFWAWKTIDFPNATFQSGVNALAVSIKLNIAIDKDLYLEIIDHAIKAIPNLTNKNDSLNEAFPNENSYCVTALVAYDTLYCIDLLKNDLGKEKVEEYFSIIEPLIHYLIKNKEKHAIISNHLATAVAALVLWEELTGKSKNAYKNTLEVIFENQSDEGWYMEYEGPDHGYQTLCVHYLSTIYSKTQDDKLKRSLQKSFKFLYHFIHPDGSIGGLYGSRNTEVIYPGGLSILRDISDHAHFCWSALNDGISNEMSLLPQDIDSDNYIPLLNSFALAALNENEPSDTKPLLPPFYNKNQKIDFKKSGIEVFSNNNYYSILNYKKGGTLKVYDLIEKKCIYDSGGVFYLKSDKIYTSQRFDKTVDINENGSFSPSLYHYQEKYPSLFQTLLIRLMAMTIFKIPYLLELFKKIVVKLLITNKEKSKIKISTQVIYGEHNLTINYDLPENLDKKRFYLGQRFKAIHMASSGYFVKNNLIKTQNKRVKEIIL